LIDIPIHNKIGDLNSLLQFVYVPGLNSAEAFKKYIIDILKDSLWVKRAKEVFNILIVIFNFHHIRIEVFISGDQLPNIRFNNV